MAVYTSADLHLSTRASTDKSMEVFGKRWDGYTERLKNNWQRLVGENDTVIIPGDISWALSLEEAESDMKFLNSLPGKKILAKGNHDFWWSTMKKHENFFGKHGIDTISFLYNNAYKIENFIIAGTRGWFADDDSKAIPDNTDYDKIVNRECLRLKASLNEAMKLKEAYPECEIIVFMHFPVAFADNVCQELLDVLKAYGIKRLYYGHIHGVYTAPRCTVKDGIEMHIISADYLDFTPLYVHKTEN